MDEGFAVTAAGNVNLNGHAEQEVRTGEPFTPHAWQPLGVASAILRDPGEFAL
jgi:hypothetical protein